MAKDRVISTVDPEARHGHKTSARSFDGYKGHISIDPDSEIITATKVTPGNAGDGAPVKELLSEVLPPNQKSMAETETGANTNDEVAESEPVEVFGDAAYGTAENLKMLDQPGVVANLKVQGPAGRKGKFSKEQFAVDLNAQTVTCPNEQRVSIHPRSDGSGVAWFGDACTDCPLRGQCTDSKDGRSV